MKRPTLPENQGPESQIIFLSLGLSKTTTTKAPNQENRGFLES